LYCWWHRICIFSLFSLHDFTTHNAQKPIADTFGYWLLLFNAGGLCPLFYSLGLEKLPSIKELQAEYNALAKEKHNCQQAKNEMKQHVSDLQAAKKNAEMLLGITPSAANHNNERDNGRTQKRTQTSEL